MVRKPVHATRPSGCSNITSPLYPSHRGPLLINPFNIIKGDIGCSGTSCGFSRNALNSHIILVLEIPESVRNQVESGGIRPESGGNLIRNQVRIRTIQAQFSSFSLFGPLLKLVVPVKAARLLTLINPLLLCLNHRAPLLFIAFLQYFHCFL